MKFTKCEKCSQEISNTNIKRHLDYCDGTGKRSLKPKTGYHAWNKGLTKEDERIAKSSAKAAKTLTGRKGHTPTEEQRKRLSEVAKKNGLGGVRQSKRILYKGTVLGSTFELKLAESLDENGIAWKTCSRFPYKDSNGKQRTYTPDFYLPEFDVYLDPKNDFLLNNLNPSLGFSDRDKIKWVEEQNGIRVIILGKNELTWSAVKDKLL